MSSVVVKDVSLSFGAIEVLKKLNLDIEKGEFLVLLGPSGCGKSTLLNCIAGLLDVTTGQIFINGKNVTWEEPKDRGIGMVFQSYALYPQMTVEGNLSFGLKNAGLPKAEIAKRVARASEILQIEALLKRKPAQLSGGQRQRVAIGRALVRDVDVFLFDEPLSNLDARLRAELRVEIKRLHQKLGNTMIYVTHRGFDAGRPHRRHERWHGAATRRSAYDLQQAQESLRSGIHRLSHNELPESRNGIRHRAVACRAGSGSERL
jgi:multiple sugar transport system ATP-binding protein